MSHRRHRVVAVSLFALVATVASPSDSRQSASGSGAHDSALWPGLEVGPDVVGYEVKYRYDTTRDFPGTPNRKRPVQISLWYPASSSDGTSRVTSEDYFLSAATEIDFSPPDDSRRNRHLDQVRAAAVDAGADPVRFDHFLGLGTLAYRDAPPARGRHPLVVFVPGHGAPAFQNTVAFEYLASHGYVVASFPSVGADGREMTDDDAGATAQVRDIEFVIRELNKTDTVDSERVAIVGYSWGGLTAVLAAMRGVKASAVVSISSTLMVKRGHVLGRSLPGYSPDALEMPILMMIADGPFEARDFGFFSELPRGRALLLRFPGLRHGDFASTIIRFFVQTRGDTGGRGVTHIDTAYATQCRYLLAFLDAYLRDSVTGKAFLASKPVDNGIPEGIVKITRN